MGEPKIDIAIKLFESNAKNPDVAGYVEPFYRNLNNGLLAMAKAIKEIQQKQAASESE